MLDPEPRGGVPSGMADDSSPVSSQPVYDARGRRIMPQPGGGYLVVNGGGGRQPGAGRPASAIRGRLRKSFNKRVPILRDIADDESLPPRDRIQALGLMAKYGLGEPGKYDSGLVSALAAAVGEVFPKDEHGGALEELERRWVAIIQEHAP